MAWVVRKDHPLAEGELTLERLRDTPHILVSGFEDPFDAEAAPGGPGLKYRRGWDRPVRPSTAAAPPGARGQKYRRGGDRQERRPSERARRSAPRKVAVMTPDSVS